MKKVRAERRVWQTSAILVGLLAFALSAQVSITADDVRGWTGGEFRRFEPGDDSLEHELRIFVDDESTRDFSEVTVGVYEQRSYRPPTSRERQSYPAVNLVRTDIEALSQYDEDLDTALFFYGLNSICLREFGFARYTESGELDTVDQFLNDTVLEFPLVAGATWVENLADPEDAEDWTIGYGVSASGKIMIPGGLLFDDVLGVRIEYVFYTVDPIVLGDTIEGIDTSYMYKYRWYSKSIGLLAELEVSPDEHKEDLLIGGYESVLADFFSLGEDQRFLRVRQTINNSGAILYPKENRYAVSEERPITRAFTLNGRKIKPVADFAVFNTATQVLVVQAAEVPELLPGL